MRKLIVLIMTSVLATGAVAQADTVNVTEDPNDYINILQITDLDGNPVTTLTPSIDGARTYYLMQAERKKLESNNIQWVAFCLYDPAVIDESNTVDALCGYSGPPATRTNNTARGLNKPESAFQLSLDGADFVNDFDNAHDVPDFVSGESTKLSSIDFNSLGADSGELSKHRFALSHATANTTGWKVRVVIYYQDDTRYELIDDENSYTIANFRSLDTGRDTTVDYGDVIPGESFTKENITTGTYRSNHPVDISISATKFESGGTAVDFATGAPSPGENKFGLDCTHGGSPGLWLSTTAQDFMTDEVASNTQTEVEDAKGLPTHSCELKVGGGVAIGSYSNVVTVDIAAAS